MVIETAIDGGVTAEELAPDEDDMDVTPVRETEGGGGGLGGVACRDSQLSSRVTQTEQHTAFPTALLHCDPIAEIRDSLRIAEIRDSVTTTSIGTEEQCRSRKAPLGPSPKLSPPRVQLVRAERTTV